MSLINQMLKDLEKRRAGETEAGAAPLGGVSSYVVTRSRRNGLLYLAGLLILLLLAVVGWLGWERYQAAPAAAPSAMAEPSRPAAAAPPLAGKTAQPRPVSEPAVEPRQSRRVPAAPVKSSPPRGPAPVATPEPDTATTNPVIKRSRPLSKNSPCARPCNWRRSMNMPVSCWPVC